VYSAIDALAQEGTWPMAQICETLRVSRSAYYQWKTADVSTRDAHEQSLAPEVREIFHHHKRRYGSRRIANELRQKGHTCSPRKAAKVMKTQGLRAIQPKSFKPKTTDSRHRRGYSPNLLLEAPDLTGIDQLWVGDITYIPLKGGSFCYLATLMDRYSRKIVGWSLGEDMTDALVLAALKMAIRFRSPQPGLIHHTDRGGQYVSNEYKQILLRAAMRSSMSRADNCYDNAFAESCFGTIKNELQMTEYQNYQDAKRQLAEFIRYYNFERTHSSIGYLTPHQFELNISSKK
jgi:transposase InsO family protein